MVVSRLAKSDTPPLFSVFVITDTDNWERRLYSQNLTIRAAKGNLFALLTFLFFISILLAKNNGKHTGRRLFIFS